MKRIFALGGGGFLMEDNKSPVDEYIRQLTGKSRPKICFISTPSGDLPEQIERFYCAYRSADCEPSHLAFFRKPSAGSVPLTTFAEHLLSQDAVFVGGGNTKSALGVWREWGLDRVLVDAYSSGVLLSGMSAGALCWFQSGLTDSFWGSGYQPLAGLGLLPGACCVHYSSEPDRKTKLLAAIEAGRFPSTVAIDDFAAVLYEDGALTRVVNWHNEASAYAVSLHGGQVSQVPYASVQIGHAGV